jgi:hypothetical protein
MASAKIGRPTVFTPDTKDLILEYVEAGLSNHEACRMVGVAHQNFYLTLSRDAEFRERYELAKSAAVDALVDDGEAAAMRAETAENGAQVAGLKVRADYKFRMASRLAPQRWGEKASVHVTGTVSTDETEMAKRVAFLEALNGKGPGNAEPDADETDGSEFV